LSLEQAIQNLADAINGHAKALQMLGELQVGGAAPAAAPTQAPAAEPARRGRKPNAAEKPEAPQKLQPFFADAVMEAEDLTPKAVPPSESVTYEQVLAKVKEMIALDSTDKLKLKSKGMDILARQGVTKMTDLKPDAYGEVYASAQRIINNVKSGGTGDDNENLEDPLG